MTNSQEQGVKSAERTAREDVYLDAIQGIINHNVYFDPETSRYCGVSAAAKAIADLPTPAPSSPGVPDSVRALSEAASPDWDTNEATPYILGPPLDGEIDRFEVIARGPHGYAKSGDAIRKWQVNRMFAVAAVRFVRDLLTRQRPVLQITVAPGDKMLVARLDFAGGVEFEDAVRGVESAIAGFRKGIARDVAAHAAGQGS